MTKPFLFLFFLLLLSPSLLLGDDYSLNGYWRGNSDGWGCGDNQDKETVIVDMNGDGFVFLVVVVVVVVVVVCFMFFGFIQRMDGIRINIKKQLLWI